MNDYNNPYVSNISSSSKSTRSAIVSRVYLNLTGAVVAYALLVALIFASVGVEPILQLFATGAKATGLIILALCFAGPFIGNAILKAFPTRAGQYAVLGYYVVFETIITLPILALAAQFFGPSVIWTAVALSISLFLALSAVVFMTRADFSFLRAAILFGSIGSFVVILVALLFGFSLGVWFSAAMVALACLYILYETSQIMRDAEEGLEVLYAINLFTSVVMLFFYILRLVMAMNRE